MNDRPTPPRGTTRVTGQGPADQQQCAGCGATIERRLIACRPCYATRVPGILKQALADTEPGTTARKRVVTRMRLALQGEGA